MEQAQHLTLADLIALDHVMCMEFAPHPDWNWAQYRANSVCTAGRITNNRKYQMEASTFGTQHHFGNIKPKFNGFNSNNQNNSNVLLKIIVTTPINIREKAKEKASDPNQETFPMRSVGSTTVVNATTRNVNASMFALSVGH